MSDLSYLALAYGVVWLGLFVYLFHLAARAEGLRREMSLLRALLQEDAPELEGPDEVVASTGGGAGGEA